MSGIASMETSIEAAVTVEEKLAEAQRHLDELQQQRAYLDETATALRQNESNHRAMTLPERWGLCLLSVLVSSVLLHPT